MRRPITLRATAPTSTITIAVVSVPRPGIRRPSSRSYSGVVAPSTTLKSQISAATLMNSGTVTKKPATKLRRSQCIGRDEQHDAEHDAVPGKRREAVAADVFEEWPHYQRGGDERHHEADGDFL